MKVHRSRTHIRWVDGGAVISELRLKPEPTHSVFDLLAAGIAALAPGPRVAVLGFAAGGLMAPLRAMGCDLTIQAVDLDGAGAEVFRRSCGEWGGGLEFRRAEASRWLARRRAKLDLIVEDLSVVENRLATKPAVSLETLPRLMRVGLASRGVAIVNLLPVERVSWSELLETVSKPFRRGVVVHFEQFENRVLITGRLPGTTRQTATLLRDRLRSIGSRLAEGVRLRSLG